MGSNLEYKLEEELGLLEDDEVREVGPKTFNSISIILKAIIISFIMQTPIHLI